MEYSSKRPNRSHRFYYLIHTIYLFYEVFLWICNYRYDKCILLDCSEGTSAQIHRFYGRTAPRIFANLKAIFVSHMHYDHFGGLIDIILARRRYSPADQKPLFLLCPKQDLKSWLLFYDNTVEPIHDDLYFIDNTNLVSAFHKFFLNNFNGVSLSLIDFIYFFIVRIAKWTKRAKLPTHWGDIVPHMLCSAYNWVVCSIHGN